MQENPQNGAPAQLYLDLLARCLTATLYSAEPDHDQADAQGFVMQFTRHYMLGSAVTMLPKARLRNIQACISTILAEEIPGDVIEAGVWRGGASIFMRGCLEVLGGGDRQSWVADSFEGLPEPAAENIKERAFFESPMMQKHYRKMAATLEEVKANFSAYSLLSDKVNFMKGWFSETLPSGSYKALSVVRLDADYYDSTMDGLINLYPLLSPGGFMIIDDYGEDLWTDCRKAVDEFRDRNNVEEPLIHVDSKCAYWRKRL